jgi:NADPH:quinone reductase-like Zn-dependent oxidoreductase
VKGMMKAVRYHDYGGPGVLRYEDAPVPEPGPGDVLVRVYAAGVNPADRQIRAGLRFRLEKPFAFIPGCEMSGVVEQTGAEVTELGVGDEVYGMLDTFGGGYADYAVAAADSLGQKPVSLDHVYAAALPVAALTAWDALFEVGGLVAGQKVLIHAAAGGVGHTAVQLAKWRNAHVIGTASASNEAFLRELGCGHDPAPAGSPAGSRAHSDRSYAGQDRITDPVIARNHPNCRFAGPAGFVAGLRRSA